MPHTPNDVFIAHLQSVTPAATNDFGVTQNLEFKPANFIFRSVTSRLFAASPTQWQSNFPVVGIQPNELIIGLAYNTDGHYPELYQVASLASLSCADDILTIGQPLAPFVAWNREESSCRHDNPAALGILDGFFDYDQSYYLAKLQARYPTCEALEKAYLLQLIHSKVKADRQSNAASSSGLTGQNKPLSSWQQAVSWFKRLL